MVSVCLSVLSVFPLLCLCFRLGWTTVLLRPRKQSVRPNMVRAGAARREQRHAKRDLARATRGKQKYKNQKGDGIKKGVIRKTARPAGRNKHGRGPGRRFDPEEEAEEGEDDVRATCFERPGVFSKPLSRACPVSDDGYQGRRGDSLSGRC